MSLTSYLQRAPLSFNEFHISCSDADFFQVCSIIFFSIFEKTHNTKNKKVENCYSYSLPMASPNFLSGMSGLPEQLIAVLLETPRYKDMNNELIVDTLLELKKHIGDSIDDSLLLSIVNDCVASNQKLEVEKKIIEFAHEMRKNQEHAKLVELTQQAEAREQAQAKAQAQATRGHQQPQWGGPSAAEEKPFYTCLPASRDPTNAKGPQQNHLDNFQQIQQPAAQSLGSLHTAHSSQSGGLPSRPASREEQTSTSAASAAVASPESHNTSLSGSKTGGGGWFKNLLWGSKKTKDDDEGKVVRKTSNLGETSQPQANTAKQQEVDSKRPQQNERPTNNPTTQSKKTPTPEPEKHVPADGPNSFGPSAGTGGVSPRPQPAVKPFEGHPHIFGDDANRRGPDSPSYGVAAVQPKPELFGSEHLDEHNTGGYYDPSLSVPAGAPTVNFGPPNSGASNEGSKETDVNFDDVFNSFLSKETGN